MGPRSRIRCLESFFSLSFLSLQMEDLRPLIILNMVRTDNRDRACEFHTYASILHCLTPRNFSVSGDVILHTNVP